MDLKSQKRIAAKILKCGISRVKVESTKEVEEALTREDIRALIKKGLIWKIQKKGTGRFKARLILKQKRKGRRKGPGSRKGSMGAGNPKKAAWIKKVRPLRMLLKELRDSGKIERNIYRQLYLKVKGGMFRNKKHLLYYLKENELFKTEKAEKTKPAKTTNKTKTGRKKRGKK